MEVGQRTHGRPLPAGFVGLSLEYPTVLSYAGTDPLAIDPVFVRLLRNLAPAQAPVLRIGGDSTDWSWWPIPKMRRPLGITYDITPGWLAVVRALARETDLRYILGINLEADNPAIEVTEAHTLLAGIGRQYVEALELGNEPELYSLLGYYDNAMGSPVPGRPRELRLPIVHERVLGFSTSGGRAAAGRSGKWKLLVAATSPEVPRG